MMWALTAISLVGVILNVQRKRSCFAFWIVSNAGWAIIDFNAGLPEQGVLFVIYFGLAVWGYVRWGR
jgi:nicotinamide riboside transporter PnuC